LTRDPLRDVRPLIGQVYAYVAYRIGAGPDAEDVTSDVFERALRYRTSYDPQKGVPLAWLIGIARRVLNDRRGLDARSLDSDAEPPAEIDLGADLIVSRLTLRQALEELDERSRDLVALRYGADMSSRDIGKLVGMTPNAVDVALHRTLGRLRTMLEEPVGPRRLETSAPGSYPKG
jgi:RNA polymerase sigma factor (sigma-70 family)